MDVVFSFYFGTQGLQGIWGYPAVSDGYPSDIWGDSGRNQGVSRGYPGGSRRYPRGTQGVTKGYLGRIHGVSQWNPGGYAGGIGGDLGGIRRVSRRDPADNLTSL